MTPMPKRGSLPWTAYLGAFLAALTLGWSVASAWFALEKRVSMLESEQRYSHGDIRPYLEDR